MHTQMTFVFKIKGFVSAPNGEGEGLVSRVGVVVPLRVVKWLPIRVRDMRTMMAGEKTTERGRNR